MYKIICRQGTSAKAHRVYKTKKEVMEDLKNYHSYDLQTENKSLNELLEIGDWELIEMNKDKIEKHLLTMDLLHALDHLMEYIDDIAIYSEEEKKKIQKSYNFLFNHLTK